MQGESVEVSAMAELYKDILIVDDELPIRTGLAEIFKLRGHKVRMAQDGFSALEAMRGMLPDVLVSDLNMPGMSGYELLSVVRRRLPAVFVVATSGAYDGYAVPECIAADAFHPKASRMQRLVELVETVERSSTLKTPRKSVSVPVWIAISSDASSGEDCAMISCPECLRAIPQMVGKTPRTVYVADCAGCHTPVQYAIVPQLDPLTSQPYTMKAAN
jgi:DNA-binding NtrC family response regulator